MKIGYVGLGKMGFNMAEHLLEKDYEVVAHNRSKEPVDEIAKKGAMPAYSLKDLVSSLVAPRLIWLMVSHQAVDAVLDELLPLLEKGDTVIDGGNSPFKDSVRRAKEIEEKGINFLDAGTSGGPGGARNGACIMVGGRKEIFDKFKNLFRDLSAPDAYGYMGKAGAGHFVKMVHNGIEYGMMQAIAEGFAIMKKSDFNPDLKEVARVYNHRSVIESRLVGWLKSAFEQYGEELNEISGSVKHTGEGKWTVETAKKLGIPVPIIEGALKFRDDSQDDPSYTGQIVSALRGQFGQHDVKKGE
ncbi:6-phosphogluconate dehydrogenase, decarboxylating [bacterium BMS3Abin15]|nr:6-phosphogluconate dehydrogenase, decarboxylating [bacterium BMS3Abin15]HDZ85587.1 decarboxylating 6-phosphogluconate dehydrogenase [Candidatus Moranbacteria bacterium]